MMLLPAPAGPSIAIIIDVTSRQFCAQTAHQLGKSGKAGRNESGIVDADRLFTCEPHDESRHRKPVIHMRGHQAAAAGTPPTRNDEIITLYRNVHAVDPQHVGRFGLGPSAVSALVRRSRLSHPMSRYRAFSWATSTGPFSVKVMPANEAGSVIYRSLS